MTASHVRMRCLLAGIALLLASFEHRAGATVGATTPFLSFEAEAGTCGGGATVVLLTNSPTTQFSSPELEASGHAYVKLSATGHYVEWTNNTGQNLTAINVRACIQDAPTGGGITSTLDLYVNGVFRQAFSVNSQQSYCYEGTNYNGQTDKNPTDGNPRGFWNDTHAFIAGAAVSPGDTLRLQQDAANTAAFYYLDVIDLETPPAPSAQPTNSLSILTYGAVSNNPTIDNTTAINNCFTAARSQGKIAWIPAGTYSFSAIHGGLSASGITILGAGPWYSTLNRVTPTNNSQGVANIITTTSSTLSNVSLDCNASNRAGNNNNGAVNFSGTNWVVDNVWIQHVTSAFWCAGVGGMARNCRVLSVWSDGGNFNNVEGITGIGMNLTYSNNFVRGTGDDAMAINSVNYNINGSTTNYYTMMRNIAYVNNTAVAAWGGKCMAVYGGINQLVTNNLLRDTARYIGLGVGKFGVNGSDLLSATVLGNTVLRCGGNGYSQQQQAMMIGNGGDGQSVGMVANAYCASNTIINALYSGVGFSTSTNIVFQYNTITSPAQDGIGAGIAALGSGVVGFAIVNSNTVTGLKAGRVALTNNASGYVLVIPNAAANYSSMSGVALEPCAEGGQDLTAIENGDWSAYSNISVTNVNTFVARVASSNTGGSIQIRLDSLTGTLLGTCQVPNTGGSRIYANAYCGLTNASGTHSLYLVYAGNGTGLFNVQFFGVMVAPIMPSHQLSPGMTISLRAANNKYVTADNNGTNALIAKSTAIGPAERFTVADAGGGNIGLLAVVNSQYVCADSSGASPLIANRTGVGSWETFAEVDAGGGNIGLRAGVNSKYVRADNNGASALIAKSTSVGAWESFTIVAPPLAPVVTPATDYGQVTLNWTASAGAMSYNVKRSMTNGGPYAVIASNLTGTNYLDAGLTNLTTYYYVISALNDAGESANSAQVSSTPGILSRVGWMASASSMESSGSPARAIDGDITTRWSTGASQANGQWFQVDMGTTNIFYQIVLDAGSSSGDFPRGYRVNVSNDGSNWGSAMATGTGSSAVTTIRFATNSARYIRVTQTGSTSGWWSIHEFNVYGTRGVPPLAPTGVVAAPGDARVTLAWNASANASGYNVKQSSASNGVYTTVATNLSGLGFTNSGLANGTKYYFAVSALNLAGESGNSVAVSGQPVSLTPPQMSFGANAGQLQLSWPQDHTTWRLQVQTNGAGEGMGTNWVTVPGSTATNQMSFPSDPTVGSVFFRMVYP
jgi:Carbohydrate binding module (family 6)/F5/8 type C domain